MTMEIDFARGKNFLARNPPPGRMLLCGVTGSHFYGFPAPDSDLDLKGIHAAPTRSVLGLRPSDAAVNLEGMEAGILCDLTSNEVGQALTLLLKGNGNMLERIFSPFQLFSTTEMGELRQLAPAFLSRRVYHHYRGFFQKVCELHVKEGNRRVKSLLYAYRTALTGIHLLRSGEVVGDLKRLAPEYGYPQALNLIAIYGSSSEKKELDPVEDVLHRSFWPGLDGRLTEAFEKSSLPEGPAAEDRCSEWLVALRLRELG